MWKSQAVNGWQVTLSPVCKECCSLVGQKRSDSIIIIIVIIISSSSMFVACACVCVQL